WAPVYVEVTSGINGLGLQPGEQPYLKVETSDFEGVNTIYRMPIKLDPNETATFVAYTKCGGINGDVNVELHVGNRMFRPAGERFQMMELQGHVYLALGRRVGDLPAVLSRKDDKEKPDNNFGFQDESQRRAALVEDNADLLPRHWFGYDGVDMIF